MKGSNDLKKIFLRMILTKVMIQLNIKHSILKKDGKNNFYEFNWQLTFDGFFTCFTVQVAYLDEYQKTVR